jgi:hypothetical protein
VPEAGGPPTPRSGGRHLGIEMGLLGVCFDLLTRAIVGGLLCLGAVAKIAMTDEDRLSWLASYRLLPGGLVRPLARLLPVIELAIGSALLLGAFGPLPALSACGLILGISVATGIALARGERPECGCFGRISHQLISAKILLRNIALALLSMSDALLVASRIGVGSVGPFWPVLLGALMAALLVVAGRRVGESRAGVGVPATEALRG